MAQRLTGVLLLDHDFNVSHTKDAVLFEGDEEEQLEKFLVELTKDYRQRATLRRSERAGGWSGEKIRELIEGLKPEFMSPEMKDAVNTAHLPPIDAIVANNERRVAELAEGDTVAELPINQELTIKISIQLVSEYEPYVTISSGAGGVIHVLVNGLHPYYQSLDTAEAIEECITQYMYDAVAEYRARSLISAPVLPDSVRNLKDALMRARIHRNDNENFRVQREAVAALEEDLKGEI